MDLHLGIRDGCSSNTQEHHHDQKPAQKHFLIALPSSSSSSSYKLNLEHMFDKVVTPSDVGKLNRLVIPKQSAEKYFPLKPSAADKGTQLTFEDPTGKPWRFRYSYWKSSRSYVMTRGWSSFVREKRLKTGDTVSFWGCRSRFFISWQCRPCHRPPHPLPSNVASIHPLSNLRSSTFRSVGPPPNARVRVWGCCGDDTGVVKRLRLFGVNIERLEPAKCQEAPKVGINNVEASSALASAENWVS